MNPRLLVTGASSVLCLVLLGFTATTRQKIIQLRESLQELRAHEESIQTNPVLAPADAAESAEDSSRRSELLRLRNEVTQLRRRQQELQSVQAEHERLRALVAARRRNAPALPTGYIRTRNAHWAGLQTPEATLQSFLWAINTRNITNVARVLTPSSAARLMSRNMGTDDALPMLPGLHPLEKTQLPDGSVRIRFEVIPGQPMQDTLHLVPASGEWRVEL